MPEDRLLEFDTFPAANSDNRADTINKALSWLCSQLSAKVWGILPLRYDRERKLGTI